MIRDYLALARPHHYLKNLFLLSPLFFGMKMTVGPLLLNALIAFAGFSLVASSLYIVNDYRDIEEDRRHPRKKDRPLAAGKVSKKSALVLTAATLSAGFVLLYTISAGVLLLSLLYFVLALAYTLKLKQIALVDIFVIAAGFVIRLFIGSAAVQVQLSMWIVLMTFLLALFLALAKRRDDVLLYHEAGRKPREAIDQYNLELLDAAMVTMAAATIIVYILYTVSPEVVARAQTDKLYLTSGFVIFGILRYLQLTFVMKKSGSPTRLFLQDPLLKLAILGWIASFAFLLYGTEGARRE